MKKRVGSALGLLFLLTLLTGCPGQEGGCDQCNEGGGGGGTAESGLNADSGAPQGGAQGRAVDDPGTFGDSEPTGRTLSGSSDVGVAVPGFGSRSGRREL